MRLATIPVFPPAFYTANSDGTWTPELGAYDLFQPEKALQAFAHAEGIPFLAMGQYMQDSQLRTGDIQKLYFKDGIGHFTSQGHTYFADALFDCFYAPSAQRQYANEANCSHGESGPSESGQ